MPSNQTYICLDCRVAIRGAEYRKPVCSRCRRPLVCIGKHWRIPAKTPVKKADKEWALLQEKIEKAQSRGRRSNYYL
jgi:hypothetical protein